MHYGADKYRQLIFILICAIYLALAFAYAILVPPWESPDEPAHYLYAKQLAERARPAPDLGIRQRDRFCRDYTFISSNHQWYQPALGYVPAAIIYKILDTFIPSSLPRQIPPLNPEFCIDPFTHHNLFIHTNPKVLAIWEDTWGVLIIRILSSLVGIIVIYTAYRIGSICDKTQGWLGIIAAAWIAFLPQFTFVNATIRSDTLTNAIAALVFLSAVLMQTSNTQISKRLALGMGVLLGLGLISKYTFIHIIPVGILAVVLRNPHCPQRWFMPLTWIILSMMSITIGYYLAFKEAHVALAYTFTTLLEVNPNALNWDYIKEIFRPLFIDMFFARFGWANVTTPTTWSRAAFGSWLTSTVLAVTHIWRQRNRLETIPMKVTALLVAGILLAIIGVIRFNIAQFQPQGRYLFPALVPWSLLGFWGWWQVLSARGKMIVTIVATSFMLIFNLYALLYCLIPAYYR